MRPREGGFDLTRLTSPEAGRRLETARLALLPVGATEQHGPNLALGTDWRVAEAIAHRAAARLGEHVLVAPALPFGLSDHHMDFPGTITLRFDTFRAVCIDVIRSLAVHGVDQFVFVNGHQGNQSALSVIASQLRFRDGYDMAVSFWMAQAGDITARHRRTERWGHACEIEGSVALAVAPDLVRRAELTPGELIDDYGAYEDNYQPHALVVPRSFAERTGNGAFGDATQATERAGEEIVAAAVDRLVAFVQDFLERPRGKRETGASGGRA